MRAKPGGPALARHGVRLASDRTSRHRPSRPAGDDADARPLAADEPRLHRRARRPPSLRHRQLLRFLRRPQVPRADHHPRPCRGRHGRGGRVLLRQALKRFTERHGEGFAMVAMKSGDAEADHAAFEQAGFGGGKVFRFTRKATLPDGSEREVGFALPTQNPPRRPTRRSSPASTSTRASSSSRPMSSIPTERQASRRPRRSPRIRPRSSKFWGRRSVRSRPPRPASRPAP